MAFGSAGYQSQKSQSSQGLAPDQRAWFSGRAPQLFGNVEGLSREAQQDPGGLQYQPVVDSLLPLGPYGLPRDATEGVYQLGRDLFSQASGSRSMRGFNSPASLEGVLGDALRMASGQLIPVSTQVALQRAQMAPALRQASFGYGTTPMQVLQNLLAGSGQSTSSGFGFNLSGGYKG